jgi:biopolymer transport protein TolR
VTTGFRRRAGSDGVEPYINVTPLVDIVLVLLIIFMVVTPQLEQDIPLNLPAIFNADPDVKASEPFKVTIAKPGEYHIDSQQYDLERLMEYLAAERALDPTRRLVVRADAGLKYKDVREFQARTQEAGFPGLSFMVNEKGRRGDEQQESSGTAAAPEDTTEDNRAALAPDSNVDAGV